MSKETLDEYYQAGIVNAGPIRFTEHGPINAAIRNRRKESGLTQMTLARKAGVPQPHIAEFELLRRLPSLNQARKIAQALNLEVEEIRPLWLKYLLSEEGKGAVEVTKILGGEKELEKAYRLKTDELPLSVVGDPVITYEHKELQEQIKYVGSTLTPREKRVIRLRFGLENGRVHSLEEVGKEFNEEPERIRQIESKTLKKLKHRSRAKYLEDYADLPKERGLSEEALINGVVNAICSGDPKRSLANLDKIEGLQDLPRRPFSDEIDQEAVILINLIEQKLEPNGWDEHAVASFLRDTDNTGGKLLNRETIMRIRYAVRKLKPVWELRRQVEYLFPDVTEV